MTNDVALADVLTAELKRLEASFADTDSILGMLVSTAQKCTLEVTLVEADPGATSPTIVAHANILPGGDVAEAWVEAKDDVRTITRDIEPGSGLHRALAVWFDDLWTSWDEVPEGVRGQVLGVTVSGLRPGDEVFRLGLTVAGIEDGGDNAAGEPVLVVRFEGTPGTEVWPAKRTMTIIRPAAEDAALDG